MSTTRVSLSWSAPNGGPPIANYHVFRGASAAGLTQLATTTKTSYMDSSVSAGTTYYYAVQTEDTGKNLSPMSPAVMVTVPTPPAAPTGVATTPISTTKISLTWSAAASGGLPIANYRVYQGSSPSNMTQLATTPNTSYTDATVSAGSTYYYAVEAADTGQDLSPMSATVKGKPDNPPSAPTNLVAMTESCTNVGLSWTGAASGGLPIGKYYVYRGTSQANLIQLATTANNSYTDRTGVAGTLYYYAVAAADTGGNLSPMSTPASTTTFTPPSAPTNLVATPMSTTKVSLTWNTAASGGLPVAHYQVYRGSSPSNMSLLTTVTGTPYTDKTASQGTTYYYGVEALDSCQEASPMSAPAMVVTPMPPSPPVPVYATLAAATRANVTWPTPTSGGLPIKNYQVFRGQQANNLTQTGTAAQTSYTDNTLQAGTTYYYAVKAVDTGGDLSAMSPVVQATTPNPPSAPTGLTATPTSTSRVSLAWNAAATGGLAIQNYQVYRGPSATNLTKLVTVLQTSYVDTSASAGATYYYGVEAVDTGGDISPMSALAMVTMPTPPAAPTGLVATPMSTTRVSLTWNAAASGGLPIMFYQVFRGTSFSNLSQLAAAAQTPYTDSSASQGTTYYYAVEAEDTGGDLSPMSAVATATAFMPPAAPAGLAALPSSSALPGAAQVTYAASLTWSAGASGGLPIQGYQIFRGSSSSNLSQVATVTQTAWTDNSLTPVTTYYYAALAYDTGGDFSGMSAAVPVTTPGPTPGDTAVFNILPMNINSFTSGSASLPGLPKTTLDGATYQDVGYQDGELINGQVLYYPHQVGPGNAGSWMGNIDAGVSQPVMISYNASGLLNGFSNPSNWTWFDLSTLQWYSKGTAQPGNNGNLNVAGGYMGGASAGNIVYPAPDYHNGYPVFIAYDSSKPLTSPSAYQTFVPPGNNTTMGQGYGFCTAAYDGRFIYYAPLASLVYGDSGNIFRYDTTQPFSNLTTGGPTPAWANFDMSLYNAGAQSFQTVVYDGNRYIYYIPFHLTAIVRYDTWNGGTGPDPTGFTAWSNYTVLDPTLLNTSGYPSVAGQGNTANLAGFTGARIVWDAAQQNEWLYFVPWATFPNNALNPTLQSTALRVRVGTQTGSAWNPVDFTSTATSPASSTPDWEMYDISLLTQNPIWPTEWPLLQSNPGLSTDSSIAGWQGTFVTSSNSEGVTFPPRVGLIPDTSEFLVEHDVGHHLWDPSGWYVTMVPPPFSPGTMGGSYDATNAIVYPSSPGAQLYAFQF